MQARVAVGLLGVLVLALAIPRLVSYLIALWARQVDTNLTVREVIAYAVQAALGVFLIRRPQVLVGFWSELGGRAA